MKNNYLYVVIAYIVMQFSSILGVPLFKVIANQMGINGTEARLYAAAYWTIFSFTITLLITLFLLRNEAKDLRNDSASSVGKSLLWAIGGVFIAFYAQSFSLMIEMALGIDGESENTKVLVTVIEQIPIFVIVTSIIGPILEEVVFRKIIFGQLYKRWNFFAAALLSSFIFGAAHMEFTHIINYTFMGFTFAFLYAKTKRIIVPIITHVLMNSTVVIMQLYREEVTDFLNKLEQMFIFIGGLL